MKRVMTWTIALIVVISGFAVMGNSQASAGLFDRNKCKPAKCKKVRKTRRNKCCQPAECCPAPCEEAAPCGCEAAAPCGCEAAAAPCGCPEATADCGCETKCQTCCSRRQIRKAKRKGCCPQECSTCGEAAAPAEGAEQAPDLPEDATT